ncbi:hypothetical protein DL764_004457 [Monosporascus ibericus]|uniref:Uncharacterized protein n=1 Tax=Monosporascus ibericus TaxID=155417 RepID=A0A4Q4TCK1_9PEZI|nr:hypothetical protein DL764_004457 [Monosporascus ibericus]
MEHEAPTSDRSERKPGFLSRVTVLGLASVLDASGRRVRLPDGGARRHRRPHPQRASTVQPVTAEKPGNFSLAIGQDVLGYQTGWCTGRVQVVDTLSADFARVVAAYNNCDSITGSITGSITISAVFAPRGYAYRNSTGDVLESVGMSWADPAPNVVYSVLSSLNKE